MSMRHMAYYPPRKVAIRQDVEEILLAGMGPAQFGEHVIFSEQQALQGSIFSDIGDAVSSVAHTVSSAATSVAKAVGSVASDIAHPLSQLAEGALKVVSLPLGVVAPALKFITNNPVWSLATSAVSMVPGLGVVSAGMSMASAVGRGASAQDIALAGAKGFLPAPAAAGLDAMVGVLLHGENIGTAGIAFLKNQLPPAAQAGADLGLAVISGKHLAVRDLAVGAAKQAIPHIPGLAAAFDAGVGAAHLGADAVAKISKLIPPEAKSVFDAGMIAAKAAQATPANLAAFRARLHPTNATHTAAANAVARAVQAKRTAPAKGPATMNARDQAKVALQHALTVARMQTHPHARAHIQALHQRATKGDRAATTSLALIALAQRVLRERGQPLPAVRHGSWGQDHYHPTVHGWGNADLLEQMTEVTAGPQWAA